MCKRTCFVKFGPVILKDVFYSNVCVRESKIKKKKNHEAAGSCSIGRFSYGAGDEEQAVSAPKDGGTETTLVSGMDSPLTDLPDQLEKHATNQRQRIKHPILRRNSIRNCSIIQDTMIISKSKELPVKFLTVHNFVANRRTDDAVQVAQEMGC